MDLVRHVEEGRIFDAMAEFYHPNVAMQENTQEPVVGQAKNIMRETQFFEGILVHEHRPLSVIVDGNRAAINWLFDFTGADDVRYRLDQIALQTWEDGRIVHERYVYDSGSLTA